MQTFLVAQRLSEAGDEAFARSRSPFSQRNHNKQCATPPTGLSQLSILTTPHVGRGVDRSCLDGGMSTQDHRFRDPGLSYSRSGRIQMSSASGADRRPNRLLRAEPCHAE